MAEVPSRRKGRTRSFGGEEEEHQTTYFRSALLRAVLSKLERYRPISSKFYSDLTAHFYLKWKI